MLKILVILSIWAAGCTLPVAPDQPVSYQTLRHVLPAIAREDTEILGKLILFSQPEVLQTFSFQDYLEVLRKENNHTADEILSLMPIFEEHLIRNCTNTFVLCLKSSANFIAICDNAATPKLDRVQRGRHLNLANLAGEVKTCK